MTQIKDVAVAVWRLEKWLAAAAVEKKMPARSAIRTINSFLRENRVEVQDLTGTKFDSGLNVDVINNEAPDAPDEDLIIAEMLKPIVLQDGAVISRGSVIISALPKEEETEEQVSAPVKVSSEPTEETSEPEAIHPEAQDQVPEADADPVENETAAST